MAQKLYKWTGSLTQPTSYSSDLPAPEWFGTDSEGVSYAYLDDAFASKCVAEGDDLAATTASTAKTWVKTNSRQAKALNDECVQEIRRSYSIDDELKAHRTDDSTVKTAIGKIVDSYTAKKNALVGD